MWIYGVAEFYKCGVVELVSCIVVNLWCCGVVVAELLSCGVV